MRGVANTAAFAFILSAFASPALAESHTWSGMCKRPGKPDAAVQLVLVGDALGTSWAGTINDRPLSAVTVDGPHRLVEFDTPGIYKGEDVVRHFRGKINPDRSIGGVLLQDQGNKWADCQLAAQ